MPSVFGYSVINGVFRATKTIATFQSRQIFVSNHTRSCCSLLFHSRLSSSNTNSIFTNTNLATPKRKIFERTILYQKYLGVRYLESDAVVKTKIRGIQQDISPLSTKKIVRKKRTKDSIPRDQVKLYIIEINFTSQYNL